MREARGLKVARRRELTHQMRERDGIRTARQRDDDARARAREFVQPESAPDAGEKIHIRLVGRVGLVGQVGKAAHGFPPDLPNPPHLPVFGAGGRIRTVDPALMRRVLSPTELPRRNFR